jgi:hypothetical protein
MKPLLVPWQIWGEWIKECPATISEFESAASAGSITLEILTLTHFHLYECRAHIAIAGRVGWQRIRICSNN